MLTVLTITPSEQSTIRARSFLKIFFFSQLLICPRHRRQPTRSARLQRRFISRALTPERVYFHPSSLCFPSVWRHLLQLALGLRHHDAHPSIHAAGPPPPHSGIHCPAKRSYVLGLITLVGLATFFSGCLVLKRGLSVRHKSNRLGKQTGDGLNPLEKLQRPFSDWKNL